MCLDPANAMVHLLDNFVRAPQLAAMVFEDDPDHDVIQVTITDPNVDGLHLRELILPDDVLVMAIARRGHSIVPHGYTNLHLEDELTLIGPTHQPGRGGAQAGLLARQDSVLILQRQMFALSRFKLNITNADQQGCQP